MRFLSHEAEAMDREENENLDGEDIGLAELFPDLGQEVEKRRAAFLSGKHLEEWIRSVEPAAEAVYGG